MKTCNFKNLKTKKVYIFPVSDLHLGSPSCNLEYFHYWEDIFKNTRSRNKIIYLLGDLIDMQSLRVGAFDVAQTADDQIINLLELLKPYKKYIRFMTAGNHTLRTRKDYNLDIGKVIAESLDVPYNSSDFFDTLMIEDEPFTIYGKHGTRFSKKQKLAEKNFIEDCTSISADLCLQGHNHYGCGFDSVVRTEHGLKLKYYGFTGHYVNYFNSYARRKGNTPNPECFMRFSVDKKLRCNWTKYDIIKERPDLLKVGL